MSGLGKAGRGEGSALHSVTSSVLNLRKVNELMFIKKLKNKDDVKSILPIAKKNVIKGTL